jgi:peptidylprolyl isomerase
MPFDPSTTKPEIEFPGDTPPTELVIEDITVGDGAEATPGSPCPAHYVGVAHSTGEEFDASWNRGAPLAFRSASARSSRAGTRASLGMKVGGRRKFVIPPHLGYGDRGAGGAIKGGETLIFVVDLVKVG